MPRLKKELRPERISGWYSSIPWAVIDSKSFRGASDRAKSLLFALMRQHDGKNNGRLQLANSWLRKQGWPSKSSNAKAIEELIERGLIVKTRTGGLNIGASRYALTWHQITNYVGLDLLPKEYQKGKYQLCNLPPTQKRKPPAKKIKHPDEQDSADPIVGMGLLNTAPVVRSKKQIIYRLAAPIVGHNVYLPLLPFKTIKLFRCEAVNSKTHINEAAIKTKSCFVPVADWLH